MDIISNFLTLIRNAYNVKKIKIKVNNSKLILNITKVLYKNKYIKFYKIYNKKDIIIWLRYINKRPIINKIIRISKQSNRKYLRHNNIKKVLNGNGISIITTSFGVMTGYEAFSRKIGGEILCIIY